MALALLVIGACTALLPAATPGPPRVDGFQEAYLAARKTFYSVLKQGSQGLPFTADDYLQLQSAQLLLPGLYEHLMNSYFLIPVPDEAREEEPGALFQELATEMAEEFLRSIPVESPRPGISPLQSLVLSTGYYAQEAIPTFRSFSRRVHRKVKRQWAFDDMEVRKNHKITKGRGIRLAIIDTGLDPSLRDIRSRVISYKDLLDRTASLQGASRFPYDWEGHGTSLASVILQVAPEVELMIVKFYEGESMGRVPASRWTHFLIAAGIMWAAHNGADIINLSVSLRHDTPELSKAIRYCWDHNIVVVTSMGNKRSSSHPTSPLFPAAYPWTIAVGGIEKTGETFQVWENSASGSYVDVVAPAKDIWVEAPQYRGREPMVNNRYGNSLATSFVAGSAALLLAAMDADTRMALKSQPGRLSDSIRSILQQTASNEKVGCLFFNSFSGHGLIEISEAIALARAWSLDSHLPHFGQAIPDGTGISGRAAKGAGPG
ncbi:MAG: S8 family serine peptidase [Candidatus Aminicenantaceae bacterium]